MTALIALAVWFAVGLVASLLLGPVLARRSAELEEIL